MSRELNVRVYLHINLIEDNVSIWICGWTPTHTDSSTVNSVQCWRAKSFGH